MINNERPDVSVIIPFHRNENQPYLDLCLRSLMDQPGVEMEIIIIAGTPKPPVVPWNVRLDWTSEPSHYAKKINRGVSLAHEYSKFLLIAQDDLLFNRTAVKGLVDMIEDYGVILNPVSNCDSTCFYEAKFEFTHPEKGTIRLPRFFKKEFIEGYEDIIMKHEVSSQILFPVIMNYLYCSLILKKVWHRIGGLDENYVNGCEDTDFVVRAKHEGVNSFVTPNAFVIHFGGISTQESDLVNTSKQNFIYFKNKWGYDLKELYGIKK